MKIPAPRRKSVAFNMTPMIDIVFQLIIFFLVSSHLAQSQSQYELDLPTAQGGELGNDQAEDKTPRLILNVLPPDAQQNDYKIVLAGESVDLSQLRQKLEYESRKQTQLEVRIRAAQTTPFRYIEPLLETCARSGVWNVKFAVYEK